MAQSRRLSQTLENGLLHLTDLPAVAHIRGEGLVWGIECAPVGGHSADAIARECVAACYHGDAQGRAVHLLGPLAGKVIRVSPPLVMPCAEAEEYLNVMHQLIAAVGQKAASN